MRYDRSDIDMIVDMIIRISSRKGHPNYKYAMIYKRTKNRRIKVKQVMRMLNYQMPILFAEV